MREVETAAERLANVVRESGACAVSWADGPDPECDVLRVCEAANELLDELHRAGILKRRP